MRTIATLIGTLAPASAFAANGLLEDNGGLFLWVFLGFCALIVAAQTMPGSMLFYKIVKGLASKGAAPAHASANH